MKRLSLAIIIVFLLMVVSSRNPKILAVSNQLNTANLESPPGFDGEWEIGCTKDQIKTFVYHINVSSDGKIHHGFTVFDLGTLSFEKKSSKDILFIILRDNTSADTVLTGVKPLHVAYIHKDGTVTPSNFVLDPNVDYVMLYQELETVWLERDRNEFRGICEGYSPDKYDVYNFFGMKECTF